MCVRVFPRRAAVLAWLGFVGSTLAATPAATAPPAPISVQTWVLDNGLKVIFAARHGAPLVNVQVVYHVGSRDEKAGQEGLARVLRELMFRGSTHVPPGAHSRLVARVGGQATSSGDEDITAFSNTVPSPYFDFALALEADRMRNLHVSGESLAAVKLVAEQARARQVQVNPVGKAVALLREEVFASHPYARGVVGTESSLRSLTEPDVRTFYDAYYVPNNAALIVTGALELADVRRLVAERFGAIPSASPASHPEPPQPRAGGASVVKLPVQTPMVAVGVPLPRLDARDHAAVTVLAELLAGGSAGLLSQRLVGANLPALAAGGAPALWQDAGLLVFFAVHARQRTPQEVRRALMDVIAALREAPIEEAVLAQARLAAAASSATRLTTADGLGQELARATVVEGDGQRGLLRPEQLLEVSVSDIGRVANRYLGEDRMTVLMLTPEAAPGKTKP